MKKIIKRNINKYKISLFDSNDELLASNMMHGTSKVADIYCHKTGIATWYKIQRIKNPSDIDCGRVISIHNKTFLSSDLRLSSVLVVDGLSVFINHMEYTDYKGRLVLLYKDYNMKIGSKNSDKTCNYCYNDDDYYDW